MKIFRFLCGSVCALAFASAAVAASSRESEPTEAEAQYRLAYQYLWKAEGYLQATEQTMVDAARMAATLFRRAAEQGHAGAQVSLGLCYRWGIGVPESVLEAVRWYRRAAEQGEAQGQEFLAQMYEEGAGVEQSFAEAEKWYRLSAAQGNPYAVEALRKLPDKVRRAAERTAEKAAGEADESSIDIEL